MEKKFNCNECNMSDYDILQRKYYLIDLRKKETELLKEKLEQKFNFEIPDYIVDDILDGEKYHHICLVIYMAVMNHELTEENGEMLKKGLKEIFYIKNDYDRIVKEILIKHTFSYEEWHDKYCNHKFIDLNNNLTEYEKEILKKLGINIENRLYTERETEIINLELISYYRNEEEMTEEELNEILPLPESIILEDYIKILDKFNQIAKDYNLSYQ